MTWVLLLQKTTAQRVKEFNVDAQGYQNLWGTGGKFQLD